MDGWVRTSGGWEGWHTSTAHHAWAADLRGGAGWGFEPAPVVASRERMSGRDLNVERDESMACDGLSIVVFGAVWRTLLSEKSKNQRCSCYTRHRSATVSSRSQMKQKFTPQTSGRTSSLPRLPTACTLSTPRFALAHIPRLKLRGLHRFSSTVSAVEEITSLQDGKLGKGLKQFLSDEIVGKGKSKDTLAVMDSKLGESVPPYIPLPFTVLQGRTLPKNWISGSSQILQHRTCTEAFAAS